MRAVVTSKRPCKMERGELRRVPQDRALRGIVGYHVCCPRCGFVTAVLNGDGGLVVTESPCEEVSFSKPARCVYCSVLIHLAAGQFNLEEDERVRNVSYR